MGRSGSSPGGWHDWIWHPSSLEILAIEPYRETAYQELMRLHAAMGNRAEALRIFARCCDLLKAELGTAPSPQTLAALRAIEGGV